VPGSFEYSGTKDIIACIQHGWEFSLRTGQSWCDPKRLRVRSHEVQVEEPAKLDTRLPSAPPDVVKNLQIQTANPPRIGTAATEDADPEAPAPGMVKGPYAVETYQVAIEEGNLYLVLDVADLSAGGMMR
jgi:nitrite reductase/ring-hydroxylating ferredoxin subunit